MTANLSLAVTSLLLPRPSTGSQKCCITINVVKRANKPPPRPGDPDAIISNNLAFSLPAADTRPDLQTKVAVLGPIVILAGRLPHLERDMPSIGTGTNLGTEKGSRLCLTQAPSLSRAKPRLACPHSVVYSEDSAAPNPV